MLRNRRTPSPIYAKYCLRRPFQYSAVYRLDHSVFLQRAAAPMAFFPRLVETRVQADAPGRNYRSMLLRSGEEHCIGHPAAVCHVGTSGPLHQVPDISARVAVYHRADLRCAFLCASIPALAC